ISRCFVCIGCAVTNRILSLRSAIANVSSLAALVSPRHSLRRSRFLSCTSITIGRVPIGFLALLGSDSVPCDVRHVRRVPIELHSHLQCTYGLWQEASPASENGGGRRPPVVRCYLSSAPFGRTTLSYVPASNSMRAIRLIGSWRSASRRFWYASRSFR